MEDKKKEEELIQEETAVQPEKAGKKRRADGNPSGRTSYEKLRADASGRSVSSVYRV